jgi:hypothetical protein
MGQAVPLSLLGNEELLDMSFSVQSVSYQRIDGSSCYPTLHSMLS